MIVVMSEEDLYKNAKRVTETVATYLTERYPNRGPQMMPDRMEPRKSIAASIEDEFFSSYFAKIHSMNSVSFASMSVDSDEDGFRVLFLTDKELRERIDHIAKRVTDA